MLNNAKDTADRLSILDQIQNILWQQVLQALKMPFQSAEAGDDADGAGTVEELVSSSKMKSLTLKEKKLSWEYLSYFNKNHISK